MSLMHQSLAVPGRRRRARRSIPVLASVDYAPDADYPVVVLETSGAWVTGYWMIDDTASQSADDVKTGGGLASGSFTGSPVDIDESGIASGNHYLHVVLEGLGGLSDVISGEYTFP